MRDLPDFQQLRLFVHVAERGSFSQVSRDLNIPVSTISRKVGELEQFLGEKLLHRGTRALTLTPEGSFYYQRGLSLVRDYEAWDQVIASRRAEPAGLLRLTAPISFGVHRLMSLIPIYRKRYPLVEVHVSLRNDVVDLIGERFDLALRLGPLADSSLKARRFTTLGYQVAAAPIYLEKAGIPQHPSQLKDHQCIVLAMSPGPVTWPFQGEGGGNDQQIHGKITVNEPMAAHTLCLAGMGIARLPDFLIQADLAAGRLRQLLIKDTPPGRDLYAVYADGPMISPKTRAFLDLLEERVGPW